MEPDFAKSTTLGAERLDVPAGKMQGFSLTMACHTLIINAAMQQVSPQCRRRAVELAQKKQIEGRRENLGCFCLSFIYLSLQHIIISLRFAGVCLGGWERKMKPIAEDN